MNFPQRKLHRLKCWDYSQNGYYYITICTQDKKKLLRSIRQAGLEAVSEPTKIGRMVLENWNRLESIYPNVKTDYFCLMPNHLHGIIIIDNSSGLKPIPLPQILRGFKSVTTREYNKLVPASEKNTLWQSSFYDEIIRNDEMLRNVRNYISGNPSKWLDDPMYTI